ncbi:hypothetical protein M9H77_18969 [Catharanthus roseus]|uniref:Uncharacterized protein n=1 Tax=Catharanthus roseus TaxID=4058 RepID=A0ACC0B901_CATRO|nr:hypothetical protein M9H77_18969 [Catharanthus roseus]
MHFLNDVRHRIYRVQGSLELSFFRVIVIIQFRLIRNGIVVVRSVNLIVVVIDSTVQHRRSSYEIIRVVGNVQLFRATSVKYGPYTSLAISESQNSITLIGVQKYWDEITTHCCSRIIEMNY